MSNNDINKTFPVFTEFKYPINHSLNNSLIEDIISNNGRPVAESPDGCDPRPYDGAHGRLPRRRGQGRQRQRQSAEDDGGTQFGEPHQAGGGQRAGRDDPQSERCPAADQKGELNDAL